MGMPWPLGKCFSGRQSHRFRLTGSAGNTLRRHSVAGNKAQNARACLNLDHAVNRAQGHIDVACCIYCYPVRRSWLQTPLSILGQHAIGYGLVAAASQCSNDQRFTL